MILDLFQSLGESTYTFHLYVKHVSSMLENSKQFKCNRNLQIYVHEKKNNNNTLHLD